MIGNKNRLWAVWNATNLTESFGKPHILLKWSFGHYKLLVLCLFAVNMQRMLFNPFYELRNQAWLKALIIQVDKS